MKTQARRYLQGIIRFWWVIAIVVVMTDAVVYLGVSRKLTTHQASLTVVLGSADLTAQQSLINTLNGGAAGYSFATALNDPSVALAVQGRFHLAAPPTFSVSTTGAVYTILATGATAEQAQGLALAIADNAIALYNRVTTAGATRVVANLTAAVQVAQTAYDGAVGAVIRYERRFGAPLRRAAHYVQSGDLVGPQTSLFVTYARLLMRRDQTRSAFTQLSNELGNVRAAQLETQAAQSPIVATSPAVVKPSSKRTLFVLLGTILGIVLGMALIVGLDYIDRRVRSPMDVETLVGLPVLTTVPRVD